MSETLIWEIFLSLWRRPAVTLALELGLFDAVAKAGLGAGLTVDDVCGQIKGKGSRRGIQAMLDVLTAMGLLRSACDANGTGAPTIRYHVTPTTREHLLADSPTAWAPMLFMVTEDPLRDDLRQAVAKEEGGNFVLDAWEQAEMPADFVAPFTAAFHAHSLGAARSLATAVAPLEGVNRLLDVGGGSGCFSIALAAKSPNLHATVLDLPAVCKIVRSKYIPESGCGDRVDTLELNFFRDAWPKGYDAAFLSNVLHDWSDDQICVILGRAYEALESGGRVLIHEMLFNDGRNGPLTTALFSMHMLFHTRGRQFTLGDLRILLEKCGFVDVQLACASHDLYSLVSARKP